MSYDLTFQMKADHIRVEVSEKQTPRIAKNKEKALNVMTKMLDQCHLKGINRILAVWNITGPIETMQAYEFGTAPDKFGWRKCFKVAAANLDKKSQESSRFTETVLVNRGYTVRIFDNVNDAETWLLDN